MTRLFGYTLAGEMLCLWLLDALLCFTIVYTLSSWDLVHVTGGVVAVQIADQAAALALTMVLTASAIGLYRPEIGFETRRLLVSTAIGAAATFALIALARLLGGADLLFGHAPRSAQSSLADHATLLGHDVLLLSKLLAAWALSLCTTHLLFSYAMRRNLFVRRVVVLGASREAARMVDAIRSLRGGLFEVAGVVPAADAAAVLDRPRASPGAKLSASRPWALIATEAARHALPTDLPARCQRLGVRICADRHFWEQHLRRVDIEALAEATPGRGTPAAGTPEYGAGGHLAAAIRRTGDIVLAAALLLLALPLMLVTAVLIRTGSPGPVLYRQERVGLGGVPFTLFKFRSMRMDAEAQGPAWASQRDPRVTAIGAFIRLTRIDELPQLVNVLRGEMSLIGPRPERPHFVAQLEQAIPGYSRRASVKPGLTGWAQVNFPYGASIEDARMKLSYDLYYVKHRTLLLDVFILFSTIRVILLQEGSR